MMHVAKTTTAALLAATVSVPVAARAGVLDLVQGTILQQRQAHGITLDSVGKEIQPGIFQVDPRAVTGRRIVLSPAASPPQLICFGSFGTGGICKGILVDLRSQNAAGPIPGPSPDVTPSPPPQ